MELLRTKKRFVIFICVRFLAKIPDCIYVQFGVTFIMVIDMFFNILYPSYEGFSVTVYVWQQCFQKYFFHHLAKWIYFFPLYIVLTGKLALFPFGYTVFTILTPGCNLVINYI